MRDQFLVIKEAVESGDFALARTLSDEFVSSNSELFVEAQSKSAAELVFAIDQFRSAGMEDEQWKIEVWLLHHFEPQNIGGPAQATVRVVE